MTTPQPQPQHDEPHEDAPPRETPTAAAPAEAPGPSPAEQPEHTVILTRPRGGAPLPPQAPPAPPAPAAPPQAAAAPSQAGPPQAGPPPVPAMTPPGPPAPTAPYAGPQPHLAGPPPAMSGQNAGYHSPLPVSRTHLGHALASEWTKIRSVRSTVWTLGVMLLLVVGIGLLAGFGMSADNDSYLDMPLLAGGMFGLMFGQICVITLGVLVVTSEYGTGMIRTTMTACPQRGRVLLAKALVFFLLAFVMTTLACTLTALIQSAILGGRTVGPDTIVSERLRDSIQDGELVATQSEWLGATVGAGLYVALLGLLSLAVGAMLRHSAGAITAMLGVVLLPLVLALFMVGESMMTLREKLMEYSPLNGLASLYRIPMQGGPDATGWPLLWLLAGVTAAALAGAYALISQRDV